MSRRRHLDLTLAISRRISPATAISDFSRASCLYRQSICQLRQAMAQRVMKSWQYRNRISRDDNIRDTSYGSEYGRQPTTATTLVFSSSHASSQPPLEPECSILLRIAVIPAISVSSASCGISRGLLPHDGDLRFSRRLSMKAATTMTVQCRPVSETAAFSSGIRKPAEVMRFIGALSYFRMHSSATRHGEPSLIFTSSVCQSAAFTIIHRSSILH